ncbi:MAG: S8 family serine peptidase [Friedmanniella sp.]
MVGLTITALTGTYGASAAPPSIARAKPVPLELHPQPVAAGAKLSPRLSDNPGKLQTVFVQLRGAGSADAAASARSLGRSAQAAGEVGRERRAAVARTADAVVAAAEAADSSTTKLFETRNSVPGVGMRATVKTLASVARRPDVVKITPVSERTINNASAAQLTKVLKTWQKTGQTGKGVSIGVIDTGIDYTHADFGGQGTAAAYEVAHTTAASGQPWTPTAKVVGGYDFAGDSYNADSANLADQIPRPDPNPLDCQGHGTHVAGTAAGVGVEANGKPFTGDYRTLTASKLDALKIGPGMAPSASLYALRVFGCTGSSNLVLPALDWALDPNGDGNPADHLDIVNLSLGSDFAPADDPENAVIDNLAKHGVLPVVAAGNAGDFTDANGSPGNATRALTVASSVDPRNVVDGLRVEAPSTLAGVQAGQNSVDYPWATAADVSGTVSTLSAADNLDGCDPLSPADAARVVGKVAWLEWDDNAATRACGSGDRSKNVAAAGAIGALFTSQATSEFAGGIAGSKEIPVFQLTGPASAALKPAAQNQTLRVTFSGALAGTVTVNDPSITDTLSTFSSRGNHGARGVVKPDVAAPGQSITSADTGTGNGRSTLSGTSMAAPHTAGIAALVVARHPSWNVGQVKAAVMNTATHDVYTEPNRKGLRYGPARVGSGRVDAEYATSTPVVAYSLGAGGVSVSFGVVEAPITSKTVIKSQKVRVLNTSRTATTVSLGYDPVVKQPGVRYSVSPSRVSVKGNSRVDVRVTMTVSTTSLRRTIDPTMSTTTVNTLTKTEEPRQFVPDASGHLLVTPTGRTPLRVPVYGAAKPVSQTKAAAGTDNGEPVINLTGRGVDQGSESTPSAAYQSAVSVLALGATSRKLPTCALLQTSGCVVNGSARSADLRYVGAGSFAEEGTTMANDGVLWFGVATWDRGVLQGGWKANVAIDTNGDGKTDFTVVGTTLPETDQPVSVLFDANGKPISLMSANFLAGDTDTNAYDNDVTLLPVVVSALGLPSTASTLPIRYSVTTFSPYGDPTGIDETPWVNFDVANPAVRTPWPLFVDAGGEALPYTTPSAAAAARLSATTKSGAQPEAVAADRVPALLLHLGGQTGRRAEVVNLPRS